MKPITRREIFENAIARGEKAPIKPMTRKEIIMAKEAEREASGGANGVMMVNVSVEAVDPSTMELVNVTADKTFEEIEDCLSNGGYAVMAFVLPDNGTVAFIPLTMYDDTSEPHAAIFIGTIEGTTISMGIASDGTLSGTLEMQE